MDDWPLATQQLAHCMQRSYSVLHPCHDPLSKTSFWLARTSAHPLPVFRQQPGRNQSGWSSRILWSVANLANQSHPCCSFFTALRVKPKIKLITQHPATAENWQCFRYEFCRKPRKFHATVAKKYLQAMRAMVKLLHEAPNYGTVVGTRPLSSLYNKLPLKIVSPRPAWRRASRQAVVRMRFLAAAQGVRC